MAVFADHPELRRYWYAVAESHEVDDGPLARTLLLTNLVVWRTPDGEVVAAPDRCPHREAPLSIGRMTDAGHLECAYHGWQFGDGGACVRVPSSEADGPVPPTAHLQTFGCVERYGLVWVCLDDDPATDIPPIPPMAWDDDSAFRRINNPVEVWATSATRMADNFVDITHFPFVHTGTFGRAQDTVAPKVELEDLDDRFFGYRYEVKVNNPDEAVATTGQTDEVLHRWMSSGFDLPFTVRSTIRYESGLEHILLLLSTPISDDRSYFTFVVWRNDDFSVPAEEIVAFDRAIGAEDKAMLEQLDGVLPLDRTGVVSVQADKASVEWRRRLAALLQGN